MCNKYSGHKWEIQMFDTFDARGLTEKEMGIRGKKYENAMSEMAEMNE